MAIPLPLHRGGASSVPHPALALQRPVTVTVAQDIASFTAGASWDATSVEAREALKLRVLDSIACTLAALEGPLPRKLRPLLQDLGGRPTCTLIGGGRAPLDLAAFYNTALLRYLDFNDAYLAAGETCHPSDSLGAVLAAAQASRASGSALLTSLAVAYQVQCRLSDEAPLRERGFDHTTHLACAVAAGAARGFGLEVECATNAIAIAATTSPALRVTRTGALSSWKGMAAAHAAMMGTYAVLLASRGITGPEAAFEGTKGFMQTLGAPFRIDWARENLERMTATSLKRFNAEVHAQSAIEATLELVTENDMASSEICQIDVETFDVAYDIIGGGREGPKSEVHTKEQADHSLPYLLAVAALDRQVMPEQFVRERIERVDVQDLLRRIFVHPNPMMSRCFPNEMPCRVTIERRDGQRFIKEKRDYLGFPTRPMSWDDVVAKFKQLTEGKLSRAAQKQIQNCVADLDHTTTNRLCELLEAIA